MPAGQKKSSIANSNYLSMLTRIETPMSEPPPKRADDRVREIVAQTRVHVIETELSLISTLCTTAETALLYNNMSEATRALQKARSALGSLDQLLKSTRKISSSLFDDYPHELAHLEERTRLIEARLQP